MTIRRSSRIRPWEGRGTSKLVLVIVSVAPRHRHCFSIARFHRGSQNPTVCSSLSRPLNARAVHTRYTWSSTCEQNSGPCSQSTRHVMTSQHMHSRCNPMGSSRKVWNVGTDEEIVCTIMLVISEGKPRSALRASLHDDRQRSNALQCLTQVLAICTSKRLPARANVADDFRFVIRKGNGRSVPPAPFGPPPSNLLTSSTSPERRYRGMSQ